MNPEPGPLTGTRCSLKSQRVTVQQVFIRGRGCLPFTSTSHWLPAGHPQPTERLSSGNFRRGSQWGEGGAPCQHVTRGLTSSGGSLPLSFSDLVSLWAGWSSLNRHPKAFALTFLLRSLYVFSNILARRATMWQMCSESQGGIHLHYVSCFLFFLIMEFA